MASLFCSPEKGVQPILKTKRVYHVPEGNMLQIAYT